MEIEYKIIDRLALADIDEDLETALNKLGTERWELILIDFNCVPYHKYFFKRNKEGVGK